MDAKSWIAIVANFIVIAGLISYGFNLFAEYHATGRWAKNVTGLLAGASGMTLKRFLPVSAAAALAWALLNALGYYWFGHAVVGASTWVRVGMVCAGLAWLVVSVLLLRRRALRNSSAWTRDAERA